MRVFLFLSSLVWVSLFSHSQDNFSDENRNARALDRIDIRSRAVQRPVKELEDQKLDDLFSDEVSESEKLYILTQNMYEEEDSLHLRAVSEAESLAGATENIETIHSALQIMEQGMQKSERVQRRAIEGAVYIIKALGFQNLEWGDEIPYYVLLNILETGIEDPSESVKIEAIHSAADLAENLENEDLSLQLLSLIARGLEEESDHVQSASVNASAQVFKKTSYNSVKETALFIIEQGQSKSMLAKQATVQSSMDLMRVTQEGSEVYKTAFRFFEWGKFQQEFEIQMGILRAILFLPYSQWNDQVFDVLEWGIQHRDPQIRLATIIITRKFRHFEDVVKGEDSLMVGGKTSAGNLNEPEYEDLNRSSFEIVDSRSNRDLDEPEYAESIPDDVLASIDDDIEFQRNKLRGLLERGLLDLDDRVRYWAESALGQDSVKKENLEDIEFLWGHATGLSNNPDSEFYEGFEELSERKKLNILFRSMKEEEDNIHSQAIEKAAWLAQTTEDREIAELAVDVIEQGLEKSESASLIAVESAYKVVLNSNLDEIVDRAMQVIEKGGRDPREAVVEIAIKYARNVAENMEDEPLEIRALSVIEHGLDEESDYIQSEAVYSAGETALSTQSGVVAESALFLLEKGKRKSLQARQEIIPAVGKFIKLAMIQNKNSTALQRAWSLLKWGKKPRNRHSGRYDRTNEGHSF